MVNLYAVLLFLWTTVYSFFVETDADFRVLYIGLLALTVLFAVCLGTTELGGGVMQVEENRSNGSRQGCKQFRTSLENHWNELQGLCASAGGEAGDALLRSLRLTFDKLSSIPANKLEGHDAELQEVDRRLLEIKMLLAPDGPDKEAGGATQICQKADELQRYVTSMKSTL